METIIKHTHVGARAQIIQALSHLAGDCKEVDPDFVASFFAELDGGLDLEAAALEAKTAFVSNLCHLLKSKEEEDGKAVIHLAGEFAVSQVVAATPRLSE